METRIGNTRWEQALGTCSLFPPTMHLDARQKQLLSTSLIPLLDSMRTSPANVGISHPSLPNSFVLVGAVAADTKAPPRPQQGGERITETYLQELTEAECIWRFRYVLVILSHGRFALEHGWFMLEHGWFALEHGRFMLEPAANVFVFHRFTMDELIMLTAILRIPEPLILSGHYHASALEALALTCACLHSPEDQWMIRTKYHHPQSAISEITHEVVFHINRVWGHLLDFDVNGIFAPPALARYADALHAHGAPTHTIISFIDCTIVQTCRPSVSEKLVYTSYKKFHRMKFQAIMVPNGMIARLDRPYHAPQNDTGVLLESGLLGHMHAHTIQPGSVDGDPPERRYFQLYGDSV